MTTGDESQSVVVAAGLSKQFVRKGGETVSALKGISFTARAGTLTALVGPDGAGKTTLLRLVAGLMSADAGSLEVLGRSVAEEPQAVQDQIGYMPQKFGLYEDLTVQENLNLYADLHGLPREARRTLFSRLMEMTNLGRFTARPAGKLSGGMKQKLGLACTLVSSPRLLLLDEPTVGVDPVSRRELWDIVLKLVKEDGLAVLVATSYLDEAQFCDHAIVMHEGRVLAQDVPNAIAERARGCVLTVTPREAEGARSLQVKLFHETGVVDAVPEAGEVRLVTDKPADRPEDLPFLDGRTARVTEPRFEDGFMMLFAEATGERRTASISLSGKPPASEAPVVEVRDLVRRFGDFVAVDNVSFEVRAGEIFGLLGPNGAGKSTTFRMLCGLLPATSGTLRVAGGDLRTARASARRRLGYVAQKFSLYGNLSVDENLDFFARAYGLSGARRRERIAWAKEQFDLGSLSSLASGQLPGGYKQRLAMAAALLHEPDILFLDEATSGADPNARREFWERITGLADQGVTIIVTTHFMEEAEYCDRIIIMDAGRTLAQGTPAEIRAHAPVADGEVPTMEEAFIEIVSRARSNGEGKAAA
jgi:ABC-type multidrug transport system, ATPase component